MSVKPIVITDDKTKESWTLEFNKEAVKFAEQRGFKYEEVTQYPMTKIPELFFYAFRMHHKNIARNQTDKILDELGGLPEGFLERLVELYLAPFESLNILDEGEERKNSHLTVEM